MKAMIFAAGLGTRLRPLTDSMPKALVEVGGKPLVRHIIDKLLRFGYNDIVLNIHHFADKIEEYFRNLDVADFVPDGGITTETGAGSPDSGHNLKIAFSDERDLLRDTGGGLLHARPLLEDAESFLLHNVDILSNLDFSILNSVPAAQEGFANGEPSAQEKPVPDGLTEYGRSATVESALATLVVSDRPSHRDLLFDEDMRLVGWENLRTGEIRSPYLKNAARTSTLGIDAPEVKACPELHNATPYAFSGIHKISSSIFPELERYAAVHGEVFSIIDFYISICADLPIHGLVPPNFQMLDAGKLDALPLAESFI